MIDLSAYDFVDFGCSAGSSIAFGKREFMAERPLGIDITQEKVAKTTDHESVVPLSAPIDTGACDPDLHGPKISPPIPLNAFRETIVFLAVENPTIAGGLLDRLPHIQILHDECVATLASWEEAVD